MFEVLNARVTGRNLVDSIEVLALDKEQEDADYYCLMEYCYYWFLVWLVWSIGIWRFYRGHQIIGLHFIVLDSKSTGHRLCIYTCLPGHKNLCTKVAEASRTRSQQSRVVHNNSCTCSNEITEDVLKIGLAELLSRIHSLYKRCVDFSYKNPAISSCT